MLHWYRAYFAQRLPISGVDSWILCASFGYIFEEWTLLHIVLARTTPYKPLFSYSFSLCHKRMKNFSQRIVIMLLILKHQTGWCSVQMIGYGCFWWPSQAETASSHERKRDSCVRCASKTYFFVPSLPNESEATDFLMFWALTWIFCKLANVFYLTLHSFP